MKRLGKKKGGVKNSENKETGYYYFYVQKKGDEGLLTQRGSGKQKKAIRGGDLQPVTRSESADTSTTGEPKRTLHRPGKKASSPSKRVGMKGHEQRKEKKSEWVRGLKRAVGGGIQ